MDHILFKYCFRLPGGTEEIFPLELDAQSLELITDILCDPPQWTLLDFHQCPHCPLTPRKSTTCPLMANLANIVSRFDNILSYDEIDLEVIMDMRRVSNRTTAQRGLSSLMGFVIASSGCPHTHFFKPMVRFHLPLASEEETIYRAVSMYLLAQYFLRKDGRDGRFRTERPEPDL